MSQNIDFTEASKRIEAASSRRDQIQQRIFSLQAKKEESDRQLAILAKETEAEFGTSDPAQLQEILDKMNTQISEAVQMFEKNVADLEAKVASIEAEYKAISAA